MSRIYKPTTPKFNENPSPIQFNAKCGLSFYFLTFIQSHISKFTLKLISLIDQRQLSLFNKQTNKKDYENIEKQNESLVCIFHNI